MSLKKDFCCTFIGLGLIGGSIAKALRTAYPECRLYAYSRHPEKIRDALEDHTLNAVSMDMTEYAAESDIIFLCAPVRSNITNLETLRPFLGPKTLITDVGSVKTDIHEAVDRLGLTKQFIGGHPMCGSEKTGYQNARANLLENAYYILTPGNGVDPQWLEDYRQLISDMHAIVLITGPEKHDFSTAAISHVPHIIAGELVRLIMQTDSPDQFMKTIAAGGFKDITRIASSSPEMWQNICQSNQKNISVLLDAYIRQLQKINDALKDGHFDSIGDLFREAGPYRNSLNDLSGSTTQKIYQLYVDIPDKTGSIAEVAGILSQEGINIRNIGITHNREHQDGVLYIVFYDAQAMQKAIPLLNQKGLTVIL